jgi:hypothetical protein
MIDGASEDCSSLSLPTQNSDEYDFKQDAVVKKCRSIDT